MPAATILVVDDEPNILSSIARALELEGYGAEVAGSAEIALEKVAQQSFDALLVDVQLPGMDGETTKVYSRTIFTYTCCRFYSCFY